MAINPSLTDLNDIIATVAVNNYRTNILTHLTPDVDPYMAYIPMGTWDATRGLSQTQLRSIGELPTAMPGAGTAWAQNTGTGSSHDLTPTTIKFGRLTRAYALAGWAFNTEAFSVRDFPHDFQAEDFLNSQLAILRRYQRSFIIDWKRENLVGNTDNKISVRGTGSSSTDFYEVTNTTARFGGFDDFITDSKPPTHALNWGVLEALYNLLARDGATEYAVGRDSLDNPVFPLIIGQNMARALFRKYEQAFVPVAYNERYADLLTPYGRKMSLYGFMPVVDLEIPRFDINYDEDGYDNIYPWTNATISSGGSGRRYTRNSAYDTAAYEAFYIPTAAQMEMHVMPSTDTAYSELTFQRQNFAGDLQWINNKTFGGTNDLGDKGFFYIENQLAPLPQKTDMGFTGLGLTI